MRQNYLICFLLLTTALVHAQYRISGHTYDEHGSVLPTTQVVLVNGQQKHTTVSNQLGFYQFENLAQGPYTLLVNQPPYQEEIPVTLLDNNLTQNLYVFKANQQEHILDDVVIQVQTDETKLERQGFAMNVIQTQEAGLRNVQTNELLDRSIGVRVRQNGGLGAAVDYNLNGMTGNSIKIFIDGMPISTYGSSFDLNSIPAALIERIEVYKGVVPIHLSDDALGGAINIVLNKGVRNSLNASLSYGSFNTLQGNFSGLYRNDKNGLTIKASGFHNQSDNNYTIWGKFARNILGDGTYEYVKAKRFNDAFRSTGGRIQAGLTDVKWADTFLLGFNISDSYNEIQHGLYMTVPYKGRFTESKAQVMSLEYKKNDLFTSGLDLDLYGMISNRDQVLNDTVSYRYNWHGEIAKGLYGEDLKTTSGAQQGAPTLNHIDRNIKTARAALSYEFMDNHKILFNHMLYDVDRTDLDLLKPIAQRVYATSSELQKNITSLAYDVHAWDNRFKANAFVKFYQQDIKQIQPLSKTVDGQQVKYESIKTSSNSASGFGLASSFEVSPSVLVLVSAERALRLPSESELFGDPSENMIANTSLKPEISENINLGVKLGSFDIQDHSFSISGSGFIRDTQDKIARKVDNKINEALQSAPFENLGKIKAIGFEAEVNYSFKNRLFFHGNVSRFSSLYNIIG